MKNCRYFPLIIVILITWGSIFSSIKDVPKIRIISYEELFRSDDHSAFTSLCEFNDTLFLAFREAPVHNPESKNDYGKLKIIKILNSVSIDTLEFKSDTIDLRDPFLLRLGNSLRLYTLYLQRKKPNDGNRYSGTMYADYLNGEWQQLKKIELPADTTYILWKVRNFNGTFYSIGYNMRHRPIVFRSEDGISWQKYKALSDQGIYTEGDLIENNGILYYLLRNEDFIGAKSVWHADTSKSIGFIARSIASPELLRLNDSIILCAGREYDFIEDKSHPDSIDVSLLLMNLDGDILERKVIPTDRLGDKGYPSFCQINDTIYISYYYGHGDNTNIYLSKTIIDGQ